MNVFDESILHGVNTLAGRSRVFDAVMAYCSVGDLVKGGVFALLIWWLWFQPTATPERKRNLIVAILGTLPAVAVARGIALSVPFRPRPFFEPELHFVVPYSVDPESLLHWSAFPSDHAAMFVALATGLCFVTRRIGALAVAWVGLVILFPRVYVGAHHPTDILAGALVGVTIALLARMSVAQRGAAQRGAAWIQRQETARPAVFHAGLFLMTWQIADLFVPLRELAHFLKTLAAA